MAHFGVLRVFTRRNFKLFSSARVLYATNSAQELDIVVSNIENALNKKNININSNNLGDVVSMLVSKYDVIPQDLENRFVEQPSVSNVQIGHWNRSINSLMDYGFDIKQIMDMIFKFPSVLGLCRDRIMMVMNEIQAHIGLSSQDIIRATHHHPELLMLNINSIRRRSEWLKTNFPKKGVLKICRKNLLTLCYSEKELDDKLQYLVTRMGLDQVQMIQSNVFSYPLSYIQTRHEFLERVGAFIRPNPKHKELNKNPHLNKILEPSDSSFAFNIAKVTLEEYELFCKLSTREGFFKEWDSRNQDDSSDDEDED